MKCVAKGVYPLDTGKVKIGCMYTPTKPHYTTEAELWMQGILLRKQSPSGVSSFVNRMVRFFVKG